MYKSTMTTLADEGPPAESTLDGARISRLPDGGIEIQDASATGPRIPTTGEFDENLAELMDATSLNAMAMRLIEFYDVDKLSRKDWQQREERALVMMGVVDIPAESDKATGVHEIVHPMLMEGAIRFQSGAIKEIFPPDGPVKTKVLGKKSREKEAQSTRVGNFLNYYLTEVDREYFADTDQMLLYLPMAGSAFRKASQDWVTGLPTLRYIKATNFIAPYSGTDLRSMPRYCHEFTMSGEDIRRAIDTGMFSAVSLTKTASGEARHANASDKADSRVAMLHDEDELYTVLEYHIDLVVDEDERGRAGYKPGKAGKKKRKATIDGYENDDTQLVRPYIVLVEKDNQKVLMVRRNWREADPKCQKRIWFAHHKYLPGLGFYGFGLPHVVGSLGMAASGAVNALLDGAMMANFQGGFKAKEGRGLGDVALEPGVWKDIDMAAEDLAKMFYTPPFKEPSPALWNMLSALVDTGQRVMGTTDSAVGDANNTGPVGTTLALIEQSQQPQSAIHKRIHKSMSDELKMLSELIHDFMPDVYPYQIGDEEQQLLKTDFDGRVDVVSVTDPNISSDTQRIMRAQAVMDMQAGAPDLYPPPKRAAAHIRMLEALKIPDIEAIAPEFETPKYLDPVAENALMLVGKGVRVFETQNDMGHILVHKNGMQHLAAVPMDPAQMQAIMTVFDAHMRDHYAHYYRKMVMQSAGIELPPLDESGMPVELDPETEAMVTAAVARKLPPPPPPPEGSPDAQAQEAQAQIERDDQLAAAQLERETIAFETEEARRQEEHGREQKRKDEAARAEQKRKDDAAAAQLVREGAKAEVQTRNLEVTGRIKAKQAIHQGATNLTFAKKQGEQKLSAAEQQAKMKAKTAAKPKKAKKP